MSDTVALQRIASALERQARIAQERWELDKELIEERKEVEATLLELRKAEADRQERMTKVAEERLAMDQAIAPLAAWLRAQGKK